jgi:hypothetical protein
MTIESHRIEQCKKLNRVRIGTSFAKWGKVDNFLLNGVIIVTNDKIRGKK